MNYFENDADAEQAELERMGARSSALRRRGICTHGWLKGIPGNPDGPHTCLHCGAGFATFAEVSAIRRELLS